MNQESVVVDLNYVKRKKLNGERFYEWVEFQPNGESLCLLREFFYLGQTIGVWGVSFDQYFLYLMMI
jgi:hypothetical protein